MPDENRFWNVRPFNWEGGRLAVARARCEGWRYVDDPDAMLRPALLDRDRELLVWIAEHTPSDPLPSKATAKISPKV